MKNIRKAAFAGSWYPSRAADCEKEINGFLNEDRFQSQPAGNFVGGVVPHAGWYFSGNLACNVISALCNPGDELQPDIIAVFGMHMHPNSTPCIMTDGAWETPFGDIEIDTDVSARLAEKFSFKIETAEHFTPDNTIELQLPFIKYFFDSSRLIPIGVPPSETTIDIARSLADIAAKLHLRIKIIGSTDLTHYGPNYGFAPAGMHDDAVEWVRDENDRKAIDVMLAMDPEGIISQGLASQNACCSGAAAGAIAASKALGAKQSHCIGYSTSYEKQPGDSFVGYTGIVFE
jgi:AmmeMemoRadiSam system protein B